MHSVLPRRARHCELPRRAWSKNGHVMCANPVHLTRLRKQWLMRASATCRWRNEWLPSRRKKCRESLSNKKYSSDEDTTSRFSWTFKLRHLINMIYFIFISQLHTPGRMSAVVYGTVIHKNQLDSCDLMCHQLWRLNLQLIFDVSLFSIPSSNKFAKISSGFISKWSGMICSWQREVARLMNHFLEWYTRA